MSGIMMIDFARDVDGDNLPSAFLVKVDETLALHLRVVLKAPLIGLMMWFSVYEITGSTYKKPHDQHHLHLYLAFHDLAQISRTSQFLCLLSGCSGPV
jgi:hypothetical protein